ncbi:hypothetical protein H4R34_004027 [Dimargaris verticillata]|uniref:Uncharacterized protein n=1 Tax=Dimargaris verticillata TaxID=2761393 RepID=A0A9W8B501_9FUNG|nr:hypothetical protein H4R34_004027 [Dimargaris verticillata]
MLGIPRAAATTSPDTDSPLLGTVSTFEDQFSNEFVAITQRLQQLESDYRQLHEELREMQFGPKVQSALDELEQQPVRRQPSDFPATFLPSVAASLSPSRQAMPLVNGSNVLNVTLSSINHPSNQPGPAPPVDHSSFGYDLSDNFSAMRLLAESKGADQKSEHLCPSPSFFTAETSPSISLKTDQLAQGSQTNSQSFPSRMFEVTELGDATPDEVNSDQKPLLPTQPNCASRSSWLAPWDSLAGRPGSMDSCN